MIADTLRACRSGVNSADSNYLCFFELLEGSHSGRVHVLGKDAGEQSPRGFESLSLRQEYIRLMHYLVEV